MKCFYHSSDLDGKMSAAIVSKFLKDCELIPINYGEQFPWHLFTNETSDKNELVYMVDFSLQPFDQMKKLASLCNLVWIDHHITAVKAASEAGPWDKFLYGMYLGEGIGACQLTWQYFSPEEVPLPVRLLALYDVWAHGHSSTKIQLGDVLAFEYGVMANEPDNQVALMQFLKGLCSLHTRESITDYINEGHAALKFLKANNREYITHHGKKLKWLDYDCIAVNKGLASSLLFESVKDQCAIKIAYCLLPNGIWTVSLYSSTVDVGEIAKKHGGGGHASAAGFQCMRLPFEV